MSELNRKASLKDVIKVFFIIFFVMLVGVGIYQSSAEEEEVKESKATVREPQTVVQLEPVYDLSQADYEIVEEEDVSYALADRFTIKVLVNDNPATEAEIKAISEKIVSDYEEKADAISIAYYFDEAQIDDGYTLALAEWAPNGKWGDAELKINQILIYKFADIVGKEIVDAPTAEEREISSAMKDLWYELMETSDFVTDEECAEILAPEYGKTVEEMMDIHWKVFSFDKGLE